MDTVIEAIEIYFVQRPRPHHPYKATLRDLFDLDPYNGGWKKFSDQGAVLHRLDAKTLGKLRDWLDENKDRAVEDYGYRRWGSLRAEAGVGGWLKQLPPDTYLGPDTDDGLPFHAVAVKTDGKKWNLNLPIRAELLRRSPRYFSERDMAGLLGMPKTSYRDLQTRMKRRAFTLDRFTADDLWAAVHGQPGRRRQSEPDK